MGSGARVSERRQRTMHHRAWSVAFVAVCCAVALGSETQDVVPLQGQEDVGETAKLTPAEEAAKLKGEDHSANIKKMAAEELAKAKAKAKKKQHRVPQDIECYWKLAQQSADQKALSENYRRLAKAAQAKYKEASQGKQELFTKTSALKKKEHRERTAMNAANKNYKAEHGKAMNAYDTAKGNLDNYNIERKKVNMDSARSKSVLQTYLKYKKLFIQASAEASDPSQSREVQQYKRLSAQHLKSYHALQGQIKRSYGAATKYNKLYTELSARYQKMAADASEIAGQVAKKGDALAKTTAALKKTKSKYEQLSQASSRYHTTWKDKQAASNSAYDRYQALEARVLDSKTNYFKMTALAKRYLGLASSAHKKSELNQVRYFNFDRDAKKAAKDIEAAIKKAALLKRKYEVADAAGVVFTKSFRANKCEKAKKKASSRAEELLSLKLLQLGEAQEAAGKGAASASQCASDKSIATANLEAAERSKLQHKQELTYLHMLREEHETATSGAKTAKTIRDAAKVKSERYRKVGDSAMADAKNPCVK